MRNEEAKIAIVDYGIGNLYSVQNACEHVGVAAVITSDKAVIQNSDGLILPGVGAFGIAMKNLQDSGLDEVIKEYANSNKFVLGVCLGMQLLMTSSDEFGFQKGLNIIEGECLRFPGGTVNNRNIKIPQIAWNSIDFANSDGNSYENTPLSTVRDGAYMYFVHSYYVKPRDKKSILCTTKYAGIEYCSAINKNNVFAFQFHPEKSGKEGLEIYSNFFKLIKNGRK